MNRPLKTAVCKKMKELRQKKGYTQQYVAELLNISQNAYSELEAGKRKLDIERLQQIAQLYSVSINCLLDQP
jgi:transcriptional regulator with XRE-family HTH domain